MHSELGHPQRLRSESTGSEDTPADDPRGLADASDGAQGMPADDPRDLADAPDSAEDTPTEGREPASAERASADDTAGLADNAAALAEDTDGLADNAPDLADDAAALADDAVRDLNRRYATVRRSVGAIEKVLLQGPRRYSRRDLAQQQGIERRLTSVYWRSLGFSSIDDDTVVFTEEDAHAIGDLAAMVEDGALSERAFSSVSRGLGFHMGRLAMWITEALVEEGKIEEGMDDAHARQAMLDALPQFLEALESQVMYTFRRQMAAYTARAGSEILHSAGVGGTDELFPLHRAVGFADLVQFTRLSRQLSGRELAEVVTRFEVTCRDVISVGGGRVVKTVGDEIMFLTDTPQDGAQIAVSLAEAISVDGKLPPARVGFAWGSMFSRYGDVFGPTVNLAARLEGVASPGRVLVDHDTAQAVGRALPGGFVATAKEEVDLPGIGPVRTVEMGRGTADPLNMGL